MPIYEYLCRECERPAELLIRSEETPTCPQCGGTKMTKLLSVPAAPASGGGNADFDGACGSGCACFPDG